MIKLIASDLDGTLLKNGSQELTPRALDLIRRLTDKGIRFVAASGRQYANERHVFRQIRDRISYIAENGSLCVHQGKVISRGILPDDLARRIIHEIKKEPGFEVVVSREEACFMENNNSLLVDHIVNVMKNSTVIIDDITKVPFPVIKISVANMTSKDLDGYLRHLQKMFSSEINVVTSGNVWIDFIVPGYNKGTALKRFMDLFGVSPKECMVFGDQYNDVEMLQLAGESYAMADAAPGIAGYAAHITDSVEDVLEELLHSLP